MDWLRGSYRLLLCYTGCCCVLSCGRIGFGGAIQMHNCSLINNTEHITLIQLDLGVLQICFHSSPSKTVLVSVVEVGFCVTHNSNSETIFKIHAQIHTFPKKAFHNFSWMAFFRGQGNMPQRYKHSKFLTFKYFAHIFSG